MIKLYLIFTIDTEDLNTPFWHGKYKNQLIFHDYTVRMINKIFQRFNIKGVFFVSLYEHCKIGNDVIKNLISFLKKRKYDIAIHTHPLWCDKKQREHMWQYSLNEQIQIIEEGKKLIKDWTGECPVAHRAGAYAINKDTLKALHINEIPIDSSMFYGHPNCKVVWSKNKVIEKNGVIEIPVTGFYRELYFKIGFKRIRIKRKFIKTDIDWAILDELKFFVEEAKKHNVKIMNLFMHSYSLLKWDKNFTNIQLDYENIQKLENFIKFIKNDNKIKVITMKDFYDLYKKDKSFFEGSDYVPSVKKGFPS